MIQTSHLVNRKSNIIRIHQLTLLCLKELRGRVQADHTQGKADTKALTIAVLPSLPGECHSLPYILGAMRYASNSSFKVIDSGGRIEEQQHNFSSSNQFIHHYLLFISIFFLCEHAFNKASLATNGGSSTIVSHAGGF